VGRLTNQHSAQCTVIVPGCLSNDRSCVRLCTDGAGGQILEPAVRTVALYNARTAAALRIAVPLFERVWLDAIAAITYVPFAHADPFVVDAKAVEQGTDPAFYTLPGEPTSSVQLGIGLRVGVP
jgi:hypothetical protein